MVDQINAKRILHSSVIYIPNMKIARSSSLCKKLYINDQVSPPQNLTPSTVKLRPEAHMDMILFEVFLKNIHLIPQDQIVQWHYL